MKNLYKSMLWDVGYEKPYEKPYHPMARILTGTEQRREACDCASPGSCEEPGRNCALFLGDVAQDVAERRLEAHS